MRGAHEQDDADRELKHLDGRAGDARLRDLSANGISDEDARVVVVNHLNARIRQQFAMGA